MNTERHPSPSENSVGKIEPKVRLTLLGGLLFVLATFLLNPALYTQLFDSAPQSFDRGASHSGSFQKITPVQLGFPLPHDLEIPAQMAPGLSWEELQSSKDSTRQNSTRHDSTRHDSTMDSDRNALFNREAYANASRFFNWHYKFAAIGGPNDGEPLFFKQKYEFLTNYRQAGHILCYRDNHFIKTVSFGRQAIPKISRILNIEMDSRKMPNGATTLKFFMVTQDFKALLAFTHVRVQVVNPTIELPREIKNNLLKVQFSGKPRDNLYVLMVSKNEDDLNVAPSVQDNSLKAHILINGIWSSGSIKKAPTSEVAINLDWIHRFYGENAKIILWTASTDSLTSQEIAERKLPTAEHWTPSAVTSLSTLIKVYVTRALPVEPYDGQFDDQGALIIR